MKCQKGKEYLEIKTKKESLVDLIASLEFRKAEETLKEYKPKAVPIASILEKTESCRDLEEQEILYLASDQQAALIAIPYLLGSGRDLHRKVAYFLAYVHPALVVYLYREETRIDDLFGKFIGLILKKSVRDGIRLYIVMLHDVLKLLEKLGERKRVKFFMKLNFYVDNRMSIGYRRG